jgi:hypothetical protein
MQQNETAISTTAVEATENSKEITTTNVFDPAQLEQFLNASEKLKSKKPVLQLTAEYMELSKPGENFRGIYQGLTTISVTDKATGETIEKAAARFIVNRKICLNAGTSLVRELKQSNLPSGTPVEVTYMKKEGNLKIYAVSILA